MPDPTPPRRFALLTDVFASPARDPGRTALVHRDRRIDHAGFERRWRSLAARLGAQGLEPGGRVVIALPKSIDAVVAMAATLAAGGVYVPVDRTQPIARTSYIVENCEPTLLVADASYLEAPGAALPARGAAGVVPVEAASAPDDRWAEAVARGPGDDAFILYTSGSTGRPKGVRISHRNLLAFIHWSLDEMDVGPGDVFSNHAALTFDLSTFDLYAAFAVGAGVVLVAEDEMRSPAVLARLIESERISVWYSVPSILQLLVASGVLETADVSSLRYVLFAGEPFPVKHLRRLIEVLPRPAYYNLYGPTETNVCTAHRVGRIAPDRTLPVPIGRPLPGARYRIVDPSGNPVAPGEEGELVIEGDCVTPGYWKLEGDRNGANHLRGVHATGDLVGLEGEDLVYRGRIDHMLKIRGFRVEPGEIEAVLETHPAIDRVAVLPVEDEGEIRLIACYSVAEGAQAPGLIALKTHCAQRLPPYMIPHQGRAFPALPTNPNGKVDRRALGEILRGSLRGETPR